MFISKDFLKMHSPTKVIITFLALCLLIFVTDNAKADFPDFKYGYVGAKGLVKKSGDTFGKDGSRYWVVYNNKGEIHRWIGEEGGVYAGLVVRSGASYLRDVKLANQNGANIPESTHVKKDTTSVLYNPDSFNVYDYSKDYTIGYLAAYYIADNMEEGGNLTSHGKNSSNGISFFKQNSDSNDFLLNPLAGIGIVSGDGNGVTDSDGMFKIHLPLVKNAPICYPITHTGFLYAVLNYSYFNPKGETATRSFVTGNFYNYMAGGNSKACSLMFAGSGVEGVANGLLIADIINKIDYQNKPVNITVDVNTLSGKARFVNKAPFGSDHIPFEPDLYEDVEFHETETEFLFSKLSRIPKEGVVIEKLSSDNSTIIYKVWIDSNNDNLIQDNELSETEFKNVIDHRGLLDKISKDDVANTDVYFYRVSNDQQLGVQQGLKKRNTVYYGGGVNSKSNSFGYHFFMRGLGSWTNSEGIKNRKERIRKWQNKSGVDDELIIAENDLRSDYPRAGEEIKVVAVNRASGYIGTATTQYLSKDGISIIVDDIDMTPPNLKIKAVRTRITNAGATKGEQKKLLIGFEGSALTSDEYIIISTDWYDHDGSMLPPKLTGYTGRLAIAAGGTDLSTIKNFPIKPGSNMQLIRLPQDTPLDRLHYYLHVNGEPIDRNPDFSNKESGSGPLTNRPAKFVPILVPVFNSKTSKYDWVYRPEMEFSVFDLEKIDYEKLDDKDNVVETHNLMEVDAVGFSNEYQFKYLLLEDKNPDLERFGLDRNLFFSIGGQEAKAEILKDPKTGLKVLTFQDVSNFKLSPEGYLTLRLYQNFDKPNILWEYNFIDLIQPHVKTLNVQRVYTKSKFDQHQEISDYYDRPAVIPFSLTPVNDGKCIVKVTIIDKEEKKLGEVIPATGLSKDIYGFVLDYEFVSLLGIKPGEEFTAVLRAELEDGTIFEEERIKCVLSMKVESNMLGQIMAHDVLIQDGSLNLSRTDFNIKGRGPDFSFTRSYNNLNGAPDSTNKSPLGEGWSHSFDKTISGTSMGNDHGDPLPDWATEVKGKFFKNDEIDKEVDWNYIFVNGTAFRLSGNKWYAQRGRHGKISTTQNDIIFTAKDGTKYYYSKAAMNADLLNVAEHAANKIKKIVDRNGNEIKFSYKKGYLTRAIDSSGRTFSFSYKGSEENENKRLSKVKGLGIEVNFKYTDDGKRLKQVKRENRKESYAYEPESNEIDHNLIKTTDSLGNSHEYKYYGEDELREILNSDIVVKKENIVKKVIYPINKSADFKYDLIANKREVKDLNNNTTTYSLNKYGNPIKIEEPLNKTTEITWSIDEGKDDNVMTSKTDFNGKTSYEYDKNGNITKETDPNGNSITTTWNKFSQPLERKDRNSITQNWDYDAKGNLEKHTNGDNISITYTYFPDTGDLKSMTTPSGTTNYTWDNYGNPDTTTLPEGSITDEDYDERGRLISVTDPNGNKTSFEYNNLDYKTAVNLPSSFNIIDGNNKLTFDYDAEGNLLKETDKNGLELNYTYNKSCLVKNITRTGFQGKKEFTYDNNGNILTESDWKGNITTHTYDALNRKKITKNRLGHTMSIDYDGAGNIESTTDYEQNITKFTYDKLNRQLSIIKLGKDGSNYSEKSFTYYNEADPKTNLKTITDEEGNETSFEYNGRYLKTKRTNPYGHTYTFEYDDSSNLIKETDEEENIIEYEYDKQNRKIKTIRPKIDDTTVEKIITEFKYDANGNVIEVISPKWTTTKNKYDSRNNLIKVTDPDNYSKEFWYDGNGNLVKEKDGNSITRESKRDKRGLVLEKTDGENNKTTFTYDENSNLKTKTAPNGLKTEITYDEEDRVLTTTQTGEGINRTSSVVNYDKMGNPLETKDFEGNITKTEYNILYQPIKITDAKGYFTTTDYYKTGQVKSNTDKRNNKTTFEIDRLGRVVKTTDPYDNFIETKYDKVGNVVQITDKKGIITKNTYDNIYRLKTVTKADILIEKNSYDKNSNLISVTDANNNETKFEYNDRNLQTKIIYADNTATSKTFDGNGNVLTITDEENKETKFTYDNENRVLTSTFANETTTNEYDKQGNLTKVIKPKQNQKTMVYDPASRLIKVDDGVLETTYKYDNNDNLTFIEAGNVKTEYVYNELNQKTKHIQYKGQDHSIELTTLFTFDKSGNPKTITDPKNNTITYTYDNLNRQTLAKYPVIASTDLNQAISVQTRYDENDNVKEIIENKTNSVTDTTINTFDNLDRLKTTTQRGLLISYDYDDNGNRTKVETVSGTTTYTYDNRNRIKTAITGDKTTTYSYYPDGKKDTIIYPNNTDIKYTYYETNRINQIINKNTDSDNLISSFTYEYDENGNRTKQTEVQNSDTDITTYIYDNADRLKEFTLTSGTDVTTTIYTFEDYNRKTETITKNSVTTKSRTYTYDETNWLTKIVDDTDSSNQFTIDYAYDNNGNTIKKTDSSKPADDLNYIYDSLDQLVKISRGPPSSQEILGIYDYNDSGLRVRHLHSERGNVEYFYDDKAVLEEKDIDNNSLLAHYRYADRLLSLDTGTEVQFYHHDALGSTVNLTKPDGSVKVSYWLDPYGTIREQVGSSVNRQIFTGQEYDEKTGLIYFGARYYDPDIARFISQDSYLGESNRPPSLHRYLYAASNPLVYIDLDGFDYIDTDKKSGDVFWVIEKDGFFYNPDQRRVNIGSYDKGKVSLTTEFGGGIVDHEKLKVAATSLWGRYDLEDNKSVFNQADISSLPVSVQDSIIKRQIGRLDPNNTGSIFADDRPAFRSKTTKRLDNVQTAADFAGTIPVIGNAVDLANTIVYGLRGKKEDFAFGMVAMLPFGQGATAAKYGRKGKHLAEEGIEHLDEGIELFYRTVSDKELARIEELNDIVPRHADYFVTQNLDYVERMMEKGKYKGKKEYTNILEIEVPAGTKKAMEKAGARAPDQSQLMNQFGHLPEYKKGMIDKVHLKSERNSLNYGLSPETKKLFKPKNIKVIKKKY